MCSGLTRRPISSNHRRHIDFIYPNVQLLHVIQVSNSHGWEQVFFDNFYDLINLFLVHLTSY